MACREDLEANSCVPLGSAPFKWVGRIVSLTCVGKHASYWLLIMPTAFVLLNTAGWCSAVLAQIWACLLKCVGECFLSWLADIPSFKDTALIVIRLVEVAPVVGPRIAWRSGFKNSPYGISLPSDLNYGPDAIMLIPNGFLTWNKFPWQLLSLCVMIPQR